MMKEYVFIDDLTSDVMFEAYGKDLKEIFTNAAKALSSVICKLDEIGEEKSIEVIVRGKDKEELMINWLQEIISGVDVEEMFFKKFDITSINENELNAKMYGEDISPEKGETVVKAVTYYKYKFEKNENGYTVRVSLDI